MASAWIRLSWEAISSFSLVMERMVHSTVRLPLCPMGKKAQRVQPPLRVANSWEMMDLPTRRAPRVS